MKNKHCFLNLLMSINNSSREAFWIPVIIDFIMPIIIIILSLLVYYNLFTWNDIISSMPSTLPPNFSVNLTIGLSAYSFIKRCIIHHFKEYVANKEALVYTRLSKYKNMVHYIKNNDDHIDCLTLTDSQQNYSKRASAVFLLIKITGIIKDKDIISHDLYLQLPEFVTAVTKEIVHGKEKVINTNENWQLPLKMPKSGVQVFPIYISSYPNGRNDDADAKIMFKGPFYIRPICLDKIELKLKGKD